MLKVIARIKGGLGNQLFCYAAARRLSLANNAELVLDHISGFSRDYKYKRKYALDKLNITARKATSAERLEPFERFRRGIKKYKSRRVSFKNRIYIEQNENDFDNRLIQLKIKHNIYLDGYWQSEKYFHDFRSTIISDFQIEPPNDNINEKLAEKIQRTNSIAIHVRWFNDPNTASHSNASLKYYNRAISEIYKNINNPHFFLFSDNIDAAKKKLNLPKEKVTVISHNKGYDSAIIDLWLMTQCKNFITANSTFSWWGAWLSPNKNKIILTPKIKIKGITSWGFRGLIPNDWIKI